MEKDKPLLSLVWFFIGNGACQQSFKVIHQFAHLIITVQVRKFLLRFEQLYFRDIRQKSLFFTIFGFMRPVQKYSQLSDMNVAISVRRLSLFSSILSYLQAISKFLYLSIRDIVEQMVPSCCKITFFHRFIKLLKGLAIYLFLTL